VLRNSFLVIGASLLFLDCRKSTDPGPAYIRGAITAVESVTEPSGQVAPFPRILVEEDPTKTILQTNSKKSLVTLYGATKLRDAAGKTISPDALKVGAIVSVWITGIVLDSYPDQVSATEIRIENQ
jgi:hypothetical protein